MNYLPVNLKHYRKRSGRTQAELAKYINKRKSTICNYENGYTEPSYELLQQIAEFLHVSVSDLLKKPAPSVRETEISQNIIPILSCTTGKPTKEFLTLPSSYLKGDNFVAFYMPNDTLQNMNLHRGDLIICKQHGTLRNGDLVAFFEKPDGISIRYYYNENDCISLTALGKSAPIQKKKNEINILGKVIKAAVSFS